MTDEDVLCKHMMKKDWCAVCLNHTLPDEKEDITFYENLTKWDK